MNEIISVPDDKYVLDLFSTALQHEGYQVIWADEAQKRNKRAIRQEFVTIMQKAGEN